MTKKDKRPKNVAEKALMRYAEWALYNSARIANTFYKEHLYNGKMYVLYDKETNQVFFDTEVPDPYKRYAVLCSYTMYRVPSVQGDMHWKRCKKMMKEAVAYIARLPS